MRVTSRPFIFKAVVLMLASGMLSSSPAWAESVDETLIKLLDDFLAGASSNDMSAHDRFWSEDLVYTSSSGARFGKAEIMAPVDDDPDDEEAAEEPAMVYGREALLVRVYGDTAVMTFRLTGAKRADPESVTRYHNTGVFLFRDDEWRAVAWQATRIPDGQ